MMGTTMPRDESRLQYALDISGTTLSILCAAHCLVLPLLLSWMSVKNFHGEWLHTALLVAVIPVVMLAFGRGFQQHRRVGVIWLGVLGVSSLLFGVIWGHALHVEGVATVTGSLLLIVGHGYNFFASREHCRCCEQETNFPQGSSQVA